MELRGPHPERHLTCVVLLLLGPGVAAGCGRLGYDSIPDTSALDGESGGSAGQGTLTETGGAFAGAGGIPSSGGGTTNGDTGGTTNGDTGGAATGGNVTNTDGGDPDSGSGGVGSGGAITGAGGAVTGSGGAPPGTGGTGTGGTGTGGAGTGGAGADTIASGEAHTCAERAGLLYCWGVNVNSALGGVGGASSNAPEHVQGPGTTGGFTAVTAGVNYGCALHTSGMVWCWGDGSRGQLGTGDVGTRTSPNPLTLASPARVISGASATTCAVLADGTLWCWGDNMEGQGGQNEFMPWSNELTPVRVPSPAAWRTVAAGQGHVCAIRASGALYCWGRNTFGQLGQGMSAPNQIRTPTQVGTATDWTAITTGQMQSCGIRQGGTLWCWGDNGAGELGLGDTAPRYTPVQVGTDADWIEISTNTFHTCGIRKPGLLYCWGRNVEGQLGVGDYVAHQTPARAGARQDWQEVSAGRFHTCVRRADASIWCAGDNPSGQLGTGNFTRVPALTPVAAFPP